MVWCDTQTLHVVSPLPVNSKTKQDSAKSLMQHEMCSIFSHSLQVRLPPPLQGMTQGRSVGCSVRPVACHALIPIQQTQGFREKCRATNWGLIIHLSPSMWKRRSKLKIMGCSNPCLSLCFEGSRKTCPCTACPPKDTVGPPRLDMLS